MKRVSFSITQRQPDGRLLGIEMEGKVKVQLGSDEEVLKIILEAELHGNDGKSRLHIFVRER